MDRSRIKYTAAAALICASVAATIGIATGAAAPSSKDKGSSANNPGEAGYVASARVPAPPGARRGGKILFRAGGPIREFGGPPVHSEMVVPTKSGEDFQTVTQDSGKVKSVSGDQLTITEGTEEATYDTVTLDIPSDAKVLRNGKDVELGDLQAGDQVHVSQSPQDSFVFATDSEFFKKAIRHRRGLPPPPGVGGLPPGIPPAPMARRGNN
jgi:hypothetical protein